MRPARGDAAVEDLRGRAEALHAVALLATLDPRAAEWVTVAALAGQLDPPDVDEQPGARARRGLHRALDAHDSSRPTSTASDSRVPAPPSAAALREAPSAAALRGGGEGAGSGKHEDLVEAVERVLRGLSPAQRRVLGLWAFDDGPLDPREERDARDRFAAGLSGLAWSPTPEEALHRFVEAHPAPEDVVDRLLAAHDQRTSSRRLRRVVAAAGVIAVTALAVTVALRAQPGQGNGQGDARPTTTASPTASGSAAAPAVTVDGVRFQRAVSLADEAGLPELPDALDDTGLSPELAIPTDPVPALSPGLVGTRGVRAILVRRLPDGTGRAVLNVPRGEPAYVELPDLVLPPARPGLTPVGPQSITRDRRRVVLPTTGGVAVVNVTTAQVRTYPVDLGDAENVGFSTDEEHVVIGSLAKPVRVVLADGSVQPMAPPGNAGRYRFVVDAAPNLLGFDGQGGPDSQHAISGPIVGFGPETVTSQTGWSAASAHFNGAVLPRRGTRGIVAATVDVSALATALLADPADQRGESGQSGEGGGCCAPLAWAPNDRLLYVSPSSQGWRILAWDIHTGQQFRVSRMPSPDFRTWSGEFTL